MLLGACSASLNTGGGGQGGATGIGGSGGAVTLPACPAHDLTFAVCIANDTEPATSLIETHTSGAATIEAVGSGATPGPCLYERVIGAGGRPSHWWFQARAADNRLWTIGVQGLGGSTPLVSRGDVVTLAVDWKVICAGPANCWNDGLLQLSDAAGTPLLWARSQPMFSAAPPVAPTWISCTAGDYVCGSGDTFCDMRESNVIATVNGSSMTLPPYGSASVGGYFVQVTSFAAGLCGDSMPVFEAAAAKASPTTTP